MYSHGLRRAIILNYGRCSSHTKMPRVEYGPSENTMRSTPDPSEVEAVEEIAQYLCMKTGKPRRGFHDFPMGVQEHYRELARLVLARDQAVRRAVREEDINLAHQLEVNAAIAKTPCPSIAYALRLKGEEKT